MPGFLGSISEFINSTNLPDQVSKVDIPGVFSNPWFLVPFIAYLGYLLYKQSWNSMILVALGFGLWFFSGTTYMKNMVDGEIELNNIAPVLAVGVGAIAVVVYVLFMRSDD
ncbi:MAG: hypothetical protein KKE17_01050 [Proteobacteria bacterium]|nr:hypothetical protein [Pseudomonadota bacterium]MBU1708569.1 hypothetical protein [Pseudomonadota bacterium]